MSVHIRYRLLKEKGNYLDDPNMTRGYTVVEVDTPIPFHKCLKNSTKTSKAEAFKFLTFGEHLPEKPIIE